MSTESTKSLNTVLSHVLGPVLRSRGGRVVAVAAIAMLAAIPFTALRHRPETVAWEGAGQLDQPVAVYCLAFHPGGRAVAAGGADRKCRVWSLATRKLTRELETPTLPADSYTDFPVLGVDFSADGKLVATASRDGAVRLWDANTGSPVRVCVPWGSHPSAANAAAFSPDSQSLVRVSYQLWQLWSVADGRLMREVSGHSTYLYSVAFAPGGAVFATGGDDGLVKLWSTPTGDLIRTLRKHTDAIHSVAFRPDGGLLATAGAEGAVHLWEVATGKWVRTLGGHSDGVIGVAFSPDGRTLATASYDHTVRLWDADSGTERQILTGHTDWVTCVAFSSDGQTLASGSLDRTVRLWRRTARRLTSRASVEPPPQAAPPAATSLPAAPNIARPDHTLPTPTQSALGGAAAAAGSARQRAGDDTLQRRAETGLPGAEATGQPAPANPSAGAELPRLREQLKHTDPRERSAAAAALGALRWQARDAVADLIAALNDDVLGVRTAARRALAEIGDISSLERRGMTVPRAVETYTEILHDNRGSRTDAVDELGRLGTAAVDAVPALVAALQDPSKSMREAVARSLPRLRPNPADVCPALSAALAKETEPATRTTLAEALGTLDPGNDQAVASLVSALEHESPATGLLATIALARTASLGRKAVPSLYVAAGSPNAALRAGAIGTLGELRAEPTQTIPLLTDCLEDPEPQVRFVAAMAMSRFGAQAKPALPKLVKLLDDSHSVVRGGAATALGAIGSEARSAIAPLRRLLQDPQDEVRGLAAQALNAIDPRLQIKPESAGEADNDMEE